MNYYNEFDPFAAQWLRNLIVCGYLPDGDVDERDIKDVTPNDLQGYTQCHFFAGIGGWSHALALAGWPEDQPVWTGSCPCQPFSAAGRGDGIVDKRHLWPHWHWLISQCQPPVVFGEQVASKDGLGWFDIVSSDLEGSGYAVGANDICAAGLGAPHIRQRLWFVSEGLEYGEGDRRIARRAKPRRRSTFGGCSDGRMGDSVSHGLEGHTGDADQKAGRAKPTGPTSPASSPSRLANDDGYRRDQKGQRVPKTRSDGPIRDSGLFERTPTACTTNGFWRDVDWLFCRDGKWRPVEPGTFPLAYGVPNRVGLLRGYGNAIVPEVAKIFIEAYAEVSGLYVEGEAA